jgi:hypothetical protein
MVDLQTDPSDAIIELARRNSGIKVDSDELKHYDVDVSNMFTVEHMSMDDLNSYSDVQSITDNKPNNLIQILDDENQKEYDSRYYRVKLKEMEQVTAMYQNQALQMTSENEKNVAIISKQDNEIKLLKEQLNDVKATSAACDVSLNMTEFKSKYTALKRECRELKEEIEQLKTSLEEQDRTLATVANRLEDRGININDILGPPDAPPPPDDDPLTIITNMANKTTTFTTPSNTISSAAKNSIMHMILLASDEPNERVKDLILTNHVHVVFKGAPEMYDIASYSDVYNYIVNKYSDIPTIDVRTGNVSEQIKSFNSFVEQHREIYDMLGKQSLRDKNILVSLLPEEIAAYVKGQL